jgi:hypothetical protein
MSPVLGPLELLIARGELERARQLLSRYDDLARDASDLQIQGGYNAATATLRLAEGDARGAFEAALKSFEGRATLGIGSQDVKISFSRALEALVILGDTAQAEELLATVEELPVGLCPPSMAAAAHRFRGRLAGNSPAAEEHLRAAVAELRRVELPYELAIALFEVGEWLAGQGRRDESQPLLDEARETFEHLRATRWLERLEAVGAHAGEEIPA